MKQVVLMFPCWSQCFDAFGWASIMLRHPACKTYSNYPKKVLVWDPMQPGVTPEWNAV